MIPGAFVTDREIDEIPGRYRNTRPAPVQVGRGITPYETYIPAISSSFSGKYTYVIYPIQLADKKREVDDSSTVQTVQAQEFTPRSKNFISRLSELTQLEENWDSYGGSPPSVDLVNKIVGLLSRANLLERTVIDAFPNPKGGIQLEWSVDDWEVEVGFYPDDHGDYLISYDSDRAQEEGSFSFADAVEILRDISAKVPV
jgi:hypothetical protein